MTMIGAAAGGGIVVLVIVLAVMFMMRRRKKKDTASSKTAVESFQEDEVSEMEEAGETRGGGSSKTKEKLPPAATPTEHEIGGTTVMGLPAADVIVPEPQGPPPQAPQLSPMEMIGAVTVDDDEDKEGGEAGSKDATQVGSGSSGDAVTARKIAGGGAEQMPSLQFSKLLAWMTSTDSLCWISALQPRAI